MDPPADGIGLQPEKLEEEKEGGPLCHCDLCDADIVYKISQSFLPGLASACIDNTTGGLFKTPATVAVDIRREMVDYLLQRSENFVAESVVLEGASDAEVSADPYDIISDFVDDFVGTKRNFFSRVSGWLLSDKREDWIDDLVQEMELNGFWLLNRRNAVAQTLLKNLDFKNIYHCNMNFKSLEDLETHKSNCSFRTMTCSNEGCDSSFSAALMDQHDSICPFKMLQCEQNCPDIIMRREMDRHCITTCPMKLVKCPFYSVGCHSTVPQCTIEQHKSESLPGHLLCVLQVLHKEASQEDLKERASELEKLSSPGRLVSARDARSLTFAIKDLEAKLGPIKVKTNAKSDEEDRDLIDKKEEKTDKPLKHVRFEELPSEKEPIADSHSDSNDHEDSNLGNRELMESSVTESDGLQTNEKEVVAANFVQEKLEESPVQREDDLGLPEQVGQTGKSSEEKVSLGLPEQVGQVGQTGKSSEEKVSLGSSEQVEQTGKSSEEKVVDPIKEDDSMSPVKQDDLTGKSSEEKVVDPIKEDDSTSPVKQGDLTEAISEKEKHAESIADNEVFTESPPGEVSSGVTTTAENDMLIDSPPGKVPSNAPATFNSEMPTESPLVEVSSSEPTTVASETSIESPPDEERLEPINREVGKESATDEEEMGSLNSAGHGEEDAKN